MPDLANLSLSCTLSHCSSLKPLPHDVTLQSPIDASDLESDIEESCSVGNGTVRVLKRSRNGGILEDWAHKKMDFGASTSSSYLPFLLRGAKKMVECLVCFRFINPGEEVSCSVRHCQGIYHAKCVEETRGVSNPSKFKCDRHACFACKKRFQWRCLQCDIAFHEKCASWPDEVIHLTNQPGRVICWRHPSDWRLDKKHVHPTNDMEEVFCRLPLPYVDEEFQLDMTSKVIKENKLEPPPYVHIRRNIYLVKKKREGDAGMDIGCTNCNSTCSEGCVCRVQCISCSRACRCPDTCSNRPFRKERRIKIVKTKLCGWGVEAAEPLDKGDFIVEYIGEVIDDALCEKRLWDMKYQGAENFYMCEIRKDFTIDATFKGNSSRFLNHSCDPNCFLEKWQVEGETRVGVFAARSINVGEPLTYDYRFVQFGAEVRCYCGASNCHGYLGMKKKIGKLDIHWGATKRRSPHARLTLVRCV